MNLSVTTVGVVLVAADPDQWRTVIVSNIDAANPIFLEIGSIPTAATGLRVAAGQLSPAIALPPGNELGAISTGGSVDTRYLVS